MVRNAFRVGLREDTPLPLTGPAGPAGLAGIGATQELDPGDILEVHDMAEAIARAEQLVMRPPARRSHGPDLFETLGQRPTDDTSGPASPAPPGVAFATPVPRYVTMPTATEDDAFFHPVGRIRSLADVTLDGYRPEPTLLVRAAVRRRHFSWIFVAVLLPLVVLAGFAIASSVDAPAPAPASASFSPTGIARAGSRAPTVRVRRKTPLATTSAAAKSGVSVASAPAMTATTPVFDVKSLPSAAPLRTKR